jgi:hypothetical protein
VARDRDPSVFVSMGRIYRRLPAPVKRLNPSEGLEWTPKGLALSDPQWRLTVTRADTTGQTLALSVCVP